MQETIHEKPLERWQLITVLDIMNQVIKRIAGR